MRQGLERRISLSGANRQCGRVENITAHPSYRHGLQAEKRMIGDIVEIILGGLVGRREPKNAEERRWQKIMTVIVIILLLGFAIFHLLVG